MDDTIIYWLLTVLVPQTSVYYGHLKIDSFIPTKKPFFFISLLLKPVELPNLFSYAFDTHTCIYVQIFQAAQLAGNVEYTNCISAEG